MFANIKQIHEFHQDIFIKEIEQCVDDYTFAGRAFTKYVRGLVVCPWGTVADSQIRTQTPPTLGQAVSHIRTPSESRVPYSDTCDGPVRTPHPDQQATSFVCNIIPETTAS